MFELKSEKIELFNGIKNNYIMKMYLFNKISIIFLIILGLQAPIKAREHINQPFSGCQSIENKLLNDQPPQVQLRPDPAPEGSFTIIVIPDTQDYTDGGSPSGGFSGEQTFNTVLQWIADNKDEQKIVFVSHVGDIVNDYNSREQWVVARQAMDIIHGIIPYGLAIGNHDMDTKTGEKKYFEEFFGKERFYKFDWYGDSYNNNSYQLITEEGINILFLHLECNAPDDVLLWADGVLNKYPDHLVIVTTHMWLGPVVPWGKSDYYSIPKGRMQWSKCHKNNNRGNTPHEIWDKLIRHHSNINMVLCGDQRATQAFRLQSVGDKHNVVHELLTDIRDGYIRLMRFTPAKNMIEVMTYSPTLKMFCDGTDSTMSGPKQPINKVVDITQHQFVISLNLQ